MITRKAKSWPDPHYLKTGKTGQKMNYKEIYSKLVKKCLNKNKELTNYMEVHHILPKCLFPERKNDKNNLVNFTYREHYVAHHLLYRYYKSIGNKNAMNKMASAWVRMCKNKDGLHVSINDFEKAKRAHIDSLRNPTDEFRKILSKGMKGKVSKMRGKHYSEEVKYRMKLGHQNISLETRNKISLALKGKNIGRIWVNNGIENKWCFPNCIPDGFKKGRIYSRKINN